MTLDEIKNRIKAIEDCKDDYEAAHCLEDQLHIDFIQFIAETQIHTIALMAQEIIKTKDIEFSRHCA